MYKLKAAKVNTIDEPVEAPLTMSKVETVLKSPTSSANTAARRVKN